MVNGSALQLMARSETWESFQVVLFSVLGTSKLVVAANICGVFTGAWHSLTVGQEVSVDGEMEARDPE